MSWGEIFFTFGSLALLVAIVFLTDSGIITLLPPHGSLVEFWLWLPPWARIVLFPGLFALNYFLTICFNLLSGASLRKSAFPAKGRGLLMFLIILLFFTLAPAIWLSIAPSFLKFARSKRWVIDLIKRKKIPWFTLLFLGVSICALALLGFLALRLWLTDLFLTLWTIIFAAATIESSFFLIWLFLPNKTGLAIWLQGHPRAAEVLNEFL
jgi:hypothetical protein